MSITTERRIGHYILGETLGEGGFSKVKLGLDERTGKQVALKIMHRSSLDKDTSARTQVEREFNAMTKVQHAHVLRLFSVDWDAKYIKKNGKALSVILVVLELARGGELYEFLSHTGCFEEAIARTYFHQLIAGLEACHSVGVAHRDLKPENLLLDDQFSLKIADFGFGAFFGAERRQMYTECGTPGYMAPEMFTSLGYDAAASDLWACGVILFIMLAGFPPFQQPKDSDWWFNKLRTNRQSLFWQAHCRSATFSEPAKDLINKLLTVEPSQRITLEGVKAHDWMKGQVLDGASLYAELSRRKKRVDDCREPPERKNGMAAWDADSLESNVHRAIGGPSTTLPEDALPSMLETHAKINVSGPRHASTEEKDATGPPTSAQPYKPAGTTSCYSRFESNKAPQHVFKRVCESLERMRGTLAVDDANLKVKVQLPSEVGTIRMRVQVFADPTRNGVSVCEFRRLQGDSLQHRRLFDEAMALLQDVVLVEPASKTQASLPAEEHKVNAAAVAADGPQ